MSRGYSLTDDIPEEPQVDEDFSNCVIVDGLPVSSMSKYEKLCGFVQKYFSKFGKIVPGGFHMAVEGKKTCGVAFIEYQTSSMARNAVVKGDLAFLDKKHQMRVNIYDDFDKLEEMEDTEWVAPEQDELEEDVNLYDWLLDDNMRDQLMVRYANETEIWWNDPFRQQRSNGREPQYKGERQKAQGKDWCNFITMFSPRGLYVLTWHGKGLRLWGGAEFEQIGQFVHPRPVNVAFSPKESYLVTTVNVDPTTNEDAVIIWDIRAKTDQKKKRGFEKQLSQFKWSHDEAYAARFGPDRIHIYQTPSFDAMPHIMAENVANMFFSPTQNILSYITPSDAANNKPAIVTLVDIETRKVLRENMVHTGVEKCKRKEFTHRAPNLQLQTEGCGSNCQDREHFPTCYPQKPCPSCEITQFWHKSGNFLAVRMPRRTNKIEVVYTVDIYRVNQRDKGIPIEKIVVPEPVSCFAWEPNGNRFAFVHGGMQDRASVSIYKMDKNKVKLIETLQDRPANALFWSTTGVLVIAGLGSLDGQLEWYNVSKKRSVAKDQHHKCNDVSWDPSGRYTMTACTSGFYASYNYSENNYRVWNMFGEELAKVSMEQGKAVTWRPRPPSLLSSAQRAEIRANLKSKYWAQFEKQDEEIKNLNMSESQREKKRIKAEWRAFRDMALGAMEDDKEARRELRGGDISEDEEGDFTDCEELEEVIISEEEVILE